MLEPRKNAGKKNHNRFCVPLRPFAGLVPLLVVLLFFGALLWGNRQDPFSRKWFTLKTADPGSVKCVAVLPKPMRRYPVIVYVHGAGDNLMNDGSDLRQMAELGLATVSLEYNKTNEAIFGAQFEALLQYLGRQKWADTNAIAWVGFSQGAIDTLDFALSHPGRQPQLLVQLSGAGMPENQTNNGFMKLRSPVLFVQGERDEMFPVASTRRFEAMLQGNGLSTKLKVIPNLSHGLEAERALVFRGIGEYCLTHLAGPGAWQNYHSIAQWQADAPPFWLFLLPSAFWAGGWFAWSRCHRAAQPAEIKLKRHEIVLRWAAAVLATWALAVTAIHLITPRFQISDKTLAIARNFLAQPKERADFEYLVAQPVWQGQKLKTLLEQVELAGYNRELVNWQLDDKMYRDFVLSPATTGGAGEKLNWRRPLWEEFYPRIRHESSLEGAARIVARHVRERVTVITAPNLFHDVPAIWLRQITDEAGFEIIYVAALRSVGVPARLDSQRQAEFWDGAKWVSAPRPAITNW